MLARNVNMSPFNGPFDLAPEAFNAVGVCIPIHVLTSTMLDGCVVVAPCRQLRIAQQFVCAQVTAIRNVLLDHGFKRVSPDIRNNAGQNVAPALQDSENDGLVGGPAPALTMRTTADIGFVGLNVPRQVVVAVDLGHVLANLVADTPSGLVGNPKLSLQFLGRDAMTRSCEQIHGVEPLLQRRRGTMERRARHRVNMVPAPRAAIGRELCKPGKLSLTPTLGASRDDAKAGFHKVLKARVVIRKLVEKLLNCHILGHFSYLLHQEYTQFSYVCQGDNYLNLCSQRGVPLAVLDVLDSDFRELNDRARQMQGMTPMERRQHLSQLLHSILKKSEKMNTQNDRKNHA